ncbi:MAG: acetylglutamate kinase [Candidatus Omnitrophota bacterium]|nr:MAG: acetylglutamate kinase [Candidatus Omnitrophota bacterium]
MVDAAIKKADVLIEALPFIRKFNKKVFVIKYGGSILGENRVRKSVLKDVAFLRYTGVKLVLVHGGGPAITKRLNSKNKVSQFINGMRVTDEFTLGVVQEELSKLNDLIVKEISSYGVGAVGLKANDNFLKATKKKSKKDLGFVGEVIDFDVEKLNQIMENDIAVISPMGVSEDAVTFNINADEVACFLASKLGAEKLVLLTNVLGVMRDPRQNTSLIPTIKVKEAKQLINRKTIDEGMIPKINAAVSAMESGVNKAHIVDAKIPHALLLEIFTNRGIGTEVVK